MKFSEGDKSRGAQKAERTFQLWTPELPFRWGRAIRGLGGSCRATSALPRSAVTSGLLATGAGMTEENDDPALGSYRRVIGASPQRVEGPVF